MASTPSVALIFGGRSSEHEISCLTAAGVAKAIDTGAFDVHPVGISQHGTWHRMSLSDLQYLRTRDRKLPTVATDHPGAVLVRRGEQVVLATLDGSTFVDEVPVDVALVLLHGAYGEDGTIQGQLEMVGVPYVGSGVAASAVGMDKHLMKVVLASAGLPIGPYEVITDTQWRINPEACVARITDNLEFPVFVKPARGGSSVGISRVATAEGLVAAVEAARIHDPKVVVEQGFVGAREIECAVLGPVPGGIAPRTSPCGEIVVRVNNGFYDFDAKYLPGADAVDLQVPAQLSDDLSARVQAVAVRSFEALGCEGLSRVDTFVTASGEVFVNEVNTMPGFTELSMFPSLWQVAGLDYRELITDLIRQALARPNVAVR